MEKIKLGLRPIAHFWIIVGVVLALFLIELSLEFRANIRGFNTLFFGSVVGVQAVTPDYPFRSNRVKAGKPAGTTRLWIAGASHARDNYQKVSDIFPSLTCTQLQSQSIPCDVLNGSEDGTGIEGNISLIEKFGTVYKPDYIILYQGSIEIQLLSKDSFKGKSNGGSAPGEWHRDFLNPIQAKLEATTLFALLQQEVRSRLMSAKILADSLPSGAEAIYRNRVIEFIEASRKIGAVPILTTFAARYSLDDSLLFDDELFRSQLRYNPYLSKMGWLKAIQWMNALNRSIGEAESVSVIDLAGPISGHPEAFRDFSHFTLQGHEWVAKALTQGLMSLLATRVLGSGEAHEL